MSVILTLWRVGQTDCHKFQASQATLQNIISKIKTNLPFALDLGLLKMCAPLMEMAKRKKRKETVCSLPNLLFYMLFSRTLKWTEFLPWRPIVPPTITFQLLWADRWAQSRWLTYCVFIVHWVSLCSSVEVYLESLSSGAISQNLNNATNCPRLKEQKAL